MDASRATLGRACFGYEAASSPPPAPMSGHLKQEPLSQMERGCAAGPLGWIRRGPKLPAAAVVDPWCSSKGKSLPKTLVRGRHASQAGRGCCVRGSKPAKNHSVCVLRACAGTWRWRICRIASNRHAEARIAPDQPRGPQRRLQAADDLCANAILALRGDQVHEHGKRCLLVIP